MTKALMKHSGFLMAEPPPYAFGGHESAVVIVCEMQEKAIEAIHYTTVVTYYKHSIALKFFQLSQEVITDNYITASPKNISTHPSYQKIIGMGKEAIPLLLEELEHRPTFWFPALYLITDENPVKKENAGVVQKMVEDWKRWGKENAYDNAL